MTPRKISRLRDAAALRAFLDELGVSLPFDESVEAGEDAPLAQPLEVAGVRVGNRFAVLPMEGWDATQDGRPTALVRRRWERFGAGGAKLIWGGEAVAVRPDGRANPNQLCLREAFVPEFEALRRALEGAHGQACGRSDDLLVGLQLTHSGRFARPEGVPAPRIAWRDPVLDRRVGVEDDGPVLSDAELGVLVEDFVRAAVFAERAGFRFVDVKHCHGYLGHELLSGFGRPGAYGGSLAHRMRFLRDVVSGIRNEAPGLALGVRLSAFDLLPFHKGEAGIGEPERAEGQEVRRFGGDGTGLGIDLEEPLALLGQLAALDVRMICVTGGSPYTNPHVQRPAFYPPSDGYRPPEDPLVGVARLLDVCTRLKRARPDLVLVASGLSYVQEWLPNVGQALVRQGGADFVGIGRLALSYPGFPEDVLAGRPLAKGAICRTFSDCTTAPRNGMISGCYPLDPAYRKLPEAKRLAALKKQSASLRGASVADER
jgi:2,4-dienoyl-CoA reductase-like NADH-dependent reductase (Old Yellow Enzyme family)